MSSYREDFLPIRATLDPDTGFLRDSPVLTRTGVFEYSNPSTGKVEREYRPANVVFDAAHLKSLRGLPIVVTHSSGLLNSKNVRGATVGTVISEGRQDGDNVIADIIVHDTSPIIRDGLKEISLGYRVDLDNQPGTHNGQRYDRSITKITAVNHLALVRKGRAGVARINMDSSEMRDDEVRADSAASARKRMLSNNFPERGAHMSAAEAREAMLRRPQEYTPFRWDRAEPDFPSLASRERERELAALRGPYWGAPSSAAESRRRMIEGK